MTALRQLAFGLLGSMSLAATFMGCPSTPPVAPGFDADVGTVDAPGLFDVAPLACANLAQLGCWEGLQPSCVERVRLIVALKVLRSPEGGVWDGACVAHAKTAVEAEACGGIVCGSPR